MKSTGQTSLEVKTVIEEEEISAGLI